MIADRLDPAACVQPRLEDEPRLGRCGVEAQPL